MKNLKIGSKISMGVICLFILLLSIAVTSIIFSVYTSNNIKKIELYSGLQNSTNELMHILNETRVNSGIFYATHSKTSYDDVTKQLMYCDIRLKKLYEYINAHPELTSFREDVDSFQNLYAPWRDGFTSIGKSYDFESEFTPAQEEAFAAFAVEMKKTNLRAHEILSHVGTDIEETLLKMTSRTKESGFSALIVVVAISAVALFSAIFIAVVLIRSITRPIGRMRDVLSQIGKYGDVRISEQAQEALKVVADGKDETAQCSSDLLVMLNQLQQIDESLSHVASGDLTSSPTLQSERDTIGLAVVQMLENLNQKFRTIADSTNQMTGKANELSEDSQLLASGSQEQANSIGTLSDSVMSVNQKTEKNTSLARTATELTDKIRENARVGTEKMNQMIQATADINAASQSVIKVIKVIDDIAFQTNILALNAAVEAARAGQHGKGFAVVAEEVRNLATKSAMAAKETGELIENTTQKAALGASIAEETSKSLHEIVAGVESSSSIMRDISELSQEQSTDITQIVEGVRHVEHIVEQNSAIASRSASVATDISTQSNLLQGLIAQFKLTDKSAVHAYGNTANDNMRGVGMYVEN